MRKTWMMTVAAMGLAAGVSTAQSTGSGTAGLGGSSTGSQAGAPGATTGTPRAGSNIPGADGRATGGGSGAIGAQTGTAPTAGEARRPVAGTNPTTGAPIGTRTPQEVRTTPRNPDPRAVVTPAVASATADALFGAAAAAGGMAEIATSRIALERAGSDEVRMFAQQMINDHTKVNRELMNLAAQKSLAVPTALDIKDQAESAVLVALSGEEFDAAYIKGQYAGHICAVNQFEAEAKFGRDADLRAFAAKNLPALKEHKMHAKRMYDAVETKEKSTGSR